MDQCIISPGIGILSQRGGTAEVLQHGFQLCLLGGPSPVDKRIATLPFLEFLLIMASGQGWWWHGHAACAFSPEGLGWDQRGHGYPFEAAAVAVACWDPCGSVGGSDSTEVSLYSL